MESPQFYLYLGVALGIIVGAGATIIYVKVKGLFSGSEVKRLTRENAELTERLTRKDRHIDQMMDEAGKLARAISKKEETP